ncbi:MAG: Crp/Fnr family transcriptional regulator [Sphaerochaetaceae bacterium]|nr:Crp/Fnr family transcriptional regulator [Sphaerochaetaceae bacterium]
MRKYCKQCIYESLPHDIKIFSLKEILFLEEEPLNYVYRIIDGLVKITRVHPSGDEKIFDILGPGDYIALIAVLKGNSNYVATAESLTELKTIRIRKVDIQKAYESNAVFQSTCLSCAVTRSTMFQNKLFQTSNIDTEEKILSTLQILATKFGTIKNDLVILKLPITKTVLASVIGIRRETLSRKLTEMQNNNIIKIENNLYKFNRL